MASTDRDWMPVSILANVVLLDQHTTAALFTMRPKWVVDNHRNGEVWAERPEPAAGVLD
ncbi:MAG: hypothetical protein WCG47_28805 [Dermatophilaceae bacterium]